jgi:hypothetical protein
MVGGDMSEIESKIAEIWCGDCEYKGKCEDAPYGGGLLGLDCKRKRDAFTSLMEALIAADRAGLVERIHELEQELNNRPSNIAHKDCNIKHFWSGNVPEFDGIKHFKDY